MGISWSKAWLLVLGVFAVLVAIGVVPVIAALMFFASKSLFWLVIYAAINWELLVFPGFLVYIGFSFKIIHQSELGILEVFGKYKKTMEPGLHIVLLGLEKIVLRPSTREQFVEILIPLGQDKASGTFTKDNVSVGYRLTFFFKLLPDPDAAVRATYEYERKPDSERAIVVLVQSVVRSITGTQDLEFLKNHYKDISESVLESLHEPLSVWGFMAVRLVVDDLLLPKDISDAIEKELIATAEGRASVAKATADKLATIETAEGDKQKRILAAEANEQEQVHDARGEASRLNEISKTLGGPQQAMAFHLGEKAVESLGRAGTTVIGLPSGDLLGGISTVVAGVMKSIASQPTPTPPPPAPTTTK